MPNKKKKYNARFPPARIKKIMQTDEEVGKVAAAVPVIISRALELFVESLIKKSSEITVGRNAKTLTTSHLKQCILSESNFDFLKDLVAAVPDVQGEDESSNPPPGETVKPYYIKQTSKTRMPRLRKNVDFEDSAGPSRTATEDSDEDSDEEDVDEDDECDDEEENNLDATGNSHGPKSTYFKNVGVTNIILSNLSSNGSSPSSVITKPATITSLHPATTTASLDEDYDS